MCEMATLKKQKIGFHDQLSLNVGQKYCRMLQREHFATLSTFIKLPFVIKMFVLSIFEWPFYTGFTLIDFVLVIYHNKCFLSGALYKVKPYHSDRLSYTY